MSPGAAGPLGSMGVELRAPQQQPPPGSGRRAFALGVLSGALAGACVAAVAASTVVGGGPTPHQGKFAAGLVRPPARREAAAPAVSMQLQNPFARPAASAPVPADPAGGDESSRREFLKEAAVFTASAATAPALFVGIFGETPPIGREWQQLPDKSVSPFPGGVFSDPMHKGGTRALTLDEPAVLDAKGFRKATITAKGGKDEPPSYKLTAYVGAGADRTKIFIDFTAKGGPKNVEGVYECQAPGLCGIKFPDGNFWPKDLNEDGQKKLWKKKKESKEAAKAAVAAAAAAAPQ